MKRILTTAASILAISIALKAGDNARFVEPLWGLDGKGNTFCGAALPFSMVKLGPDGYESGRWSTPNSGYESGCRVYGFSHTHTSGTGGGAKYGHFPVMPLTQSFNRRDISSTISIELAQPGFFSCTLDKEKVECELTLTPSVGFHRYRSIEGKPLTILIDASTLLDKGSTPQHQLASGIEIISDTEVEGWLCSEGGWNVGEPYTVYFHAVADTPAVSFGTFRDGRMSEGSRKETSLNRNDHSRKAAWLSFDSHEVVLKVAISFLSIEKARENYRTQAAALGFDEAKAKARQAWNAYLDKIEVDAEPLQKMKVYTGLYHSMLMPVDRTGEMPGWEAGETYFDDYYAIWDTFRTVSPLLSLTAPEILAAQINSLINIGKHEGWMPDARSGNCSGLTQGGTDCDIMVADAAARGIEGVDYEAALELMIKNANELSDNTKRYGREGIDEFVSKGYVTSAHKLSGSRQMEYCACDAAIAALALQLGKEELAAQYRSRSGNWELLWNPDASSEGFRGFITPKDAEGNFVEGYDVTETGIWDKAFYEGSSWQYSFFVPHDFDRLIELCGGRDEFVRRLDFFFQRGLNDNEKAFYNVGNEPSFLTPMLYTAAGRYDRTALTVNRIQNECFKFGREGLPGNDDSGAMSSWSAFNVLGFFPLAGTDRYFLTSPQIRSATLKLENGRTFRIIVHGEGIYINKARINGRKLETAQIRHGEIVSGGTLELHMSTKPGKFGKK